MLHAYRLIYAFNLYILRLFARFNHGFRFGIGKRLQIHAADGGVVRQWSENAFITGFKLVHRSEGQGISPLMPYMNAGLRTAYGASAKDVV